MAIRIVVDTSVLIKWFKTRDEELLDEAHSLLAEVEARAVEVHVPALLLYEIGSILLLKTHLDSAALETAFENLAALPFKVAPPIQLLLARAADLGRQFDLTFYDASFLALAVELECLCITADRRFFDRARKLRRMRHLAEIGPFD